MNSVPAFLNKITMYRLMLYFLIVLVSAAILLSTLKILPYDAWNIFLQTLVFLILCWGINTGIARFLKIKPNVESSLITALILTCITGPFSLPEEWLPLLVAAVAAIASKYIFAFRRSHIFNPAALGVLASALLVGYPATWWIGSSATSPILLIGGLLVMQKIRRFHLVGSFLAMYLGLLAADAFFIQKQSLLTTATFLQNLLLGTSLLFFAFVMLPEPLTAPQTRQRRLMFGMFIGIILFLFQRFLPVIPYSLELSLLIGNIFTRLINPDFRQALALRRKDFPAPLVGNFWFEPTRSFAFAPGQFLEYTLGHPHSDSRGIRRFFTIASSPTEKNILLTSKFSEPGSTFKQHLRRLEAGGEIIASKVGGEFTLPPDSAQKLAFIAGGIGITPFRSIVKYLLDTKQARHITLLYAAREEKDLVFRDIFEQARKVFDLRPVYVLSETSRLPAGWTGKSGIIDEKLIRETVPDFNERIWYISGPEPMVQGLAKVLLSMKISRKQIKRDYFPGYEA